MMTNEEANRKIFWCIVGLVATLAIMYYVGSTEGWMSGVDLVIWTRGKDYPS